MITGNYELSLKAPIGVLTATLKLSEENGVYGGVLVDPNGENPLENVAVDGSNITYTVQIKSPMGKMKLSMNINIEGDEVTGKAKMMMGALDVTGKRV